MLSIGTDSEILKLRRECIDLALRVPANQKDYVSNQLGQQIPISTPKTTDLILSEADKIFEWLTKDKKL